MLGSIFIAGGGVLAYAGWRTTKQKNLADFLIRPEDTVEALSVLPKQIQGQLDQAKSRVSKIPDLKSVVEAMLPISHRQPTKLIYQLASPWHDLTLDVPPPKGVIGKKPANIIKGRWRLYGQYFYSYWRPYWHWGLVAVLLSGSFGIYLIVYAAKLKILLDGIAITSIGAILLTLLKLLALLPVAFLASLLGEYLAARLSSRIVNDVRYDMFDQAQALSLDYYKQAKLGDMLSRFSSDMANMESALGLQLLKLFTNSFLVLVYMAAIFWLEWHLALFILVVTPLTAYLMRRFLPDVTKSNWVLRQREALALSAVQEGLRAQPIVKSFGLRQFMQEAYGQELLKLEQANTQAKFQINSLAIYTMMFMNLLDGASLGFGILLAALGVVPISTLIALQVLLIAMRRELHISTFLATMVVEGVASVERIHQIFQLPVEITDTEGAIQLSNFQNAISLQGVSFSYTGNEYQLKDINLTIESGQFVAFVGPSGAGKSTMLNLFMRFYDVADGRIMVDGYDIRDVTQGSWRAQTGIVLQETFFFNTSILNNIRVVRPESTEAEVIEAAKAAELHDFILTLPDGYATNVGEGGDKLSGGQKQRVAIARAMLCKPNILLLDEATSSLDADTAAAINTTIQKLAKRCTVIAITHSLASTVNADTIYVLDKGHLVEEGNHASLSAQGGLYAQLWQTQTSGASAVNGNMVQLIDS